MVTEDAMTSLGNFSRIWGRMEAISVVASRVSLNWPFRLWKRIIMTVVFVRRMEDVKNMEAKLRVLE